MRGEGAGKAGNEGTREQETEGLGTRGGAVTQKSKNH